jgi:hypothetical protein
MYCSFLSAVVGVVTCPAVLHSAVLRAAPLPDSLHLVPNASQQQQCLGWAGCSVVAYGVMTLPSMHRHTHAVE